MSLTTHYVASDIFNLERVVQQTGMLQTKNILIDTLRDVFSRDRHFKYVSDVFGFPKTPSHLGLDSDAGLDDNETTRIFIGSTYRYDIKFNPSIIIKNTGSKYTPISFNQNLLNVIYRVEVIMDGYGNQTSINTPAFHTLVGAWDQTYEVKIISENEVDREELFDIVQIALMSTRRLDLQKAGVFIRGMSSSGEAEQKYSNDYLYTAALNLDIRTEFKINIPISNLVERIGLCLAFKTLDSDVEADALAVNQTITHADLL
jgi:hypothetical protein